VRISQLQNHLQRAGKTRVYTTVTETAIHYPTDSSLLGDGVRVLTRTMKRIVEIGGNVGERVRDRMRSVSHRVMEIARTSRSRVKNQGKEKTSTRLQAIIE
jgi:transposase, IS5 family